MSVAVLFALVLVIGGGFCIHVRRRRSLRAYQAMLALAGCYFIARSLLGAWALHLAAPTFNASPAARGIAHATRPARATNNDPHPRAPGALALSLMKGRRIM